MKKKLYPINLIPILTIMLLSIGCGPNQNEVLAEFDGGQVQRSELKALMMLESGPEAANKASIDTQSAKLRQIAMMKIVAAEYKKQNNNSDPKAEATYNKMAPLRELEAKQLNYTNKLKTDIDNLELEMLELQFLYLKQNPGAPDRNQEAQDYLHKLNNSNLSKNDIEDFIQKKSEHGRYKWLGGYLEPICLACNTRSPLMGISSSQIQKSLKDQKNRFVLIPRTTELIILRRVQEKSITIDELEDFQLEYFRKTMRLSNHYAQHAAPEQKAAAAAASMAKTDEQLEKSNHQIAKRRRQDYMKNITRIRVEQLRQKLNFKWKLTDNEAYVNLMKPTTDQGTVLFSIQDKDYVLSDLKQDLKRLGLDAENSASLPGIINGILIPEKLLKHDPLFESSAEGQNFKLFQKLIELRSSNQKYYASLKLPEIPVGEIRDFYKKQSQARPGGPGFNQLKDKIHTYLQNQKRGKVIQTRNKTLAQKYKLVIKSKLLKANEL